MAFTRRRFIQATGAGIGASALGFPAVVGAQSGPLRVGLMTVKTGPLASGGVIPGSTTAFDQLGDQVAQIATRVLGFTCVSPV